MAIAILLGGDRWACCEYAEVALEMGRILGVATMAPQGEMDCGQPTIVGLYVSPTYRRRGLGTSLLTAAVREFVNLGLVPVRVDLLSTAVQKTLEKLPEDLRKQVTAPDFGVGALDRIFAPRS